MSGVHLFDFKDYRDYLEKRLKSPDIGRGGKARLAAHLTCQPSFVSQVLKAKSTFSLEQAFKVNDFLNHNFLQREYFMVLVELDRAGTIELQNFYEGKRKQLIEKSKLIENQMEFEQLSEADSMAYYNNINHILIRNYIDIPQYKSPKSLQNKLNLSKAEFEKALDFMISKGLVKRNSRGELEQGQVRLHIKKDSPIATYANLKARWQIIKRYEQGVEDSLNYGHYMTLSRKGYEEFKKRFRALIVDLNKHLEEDEEAEMMAALVVDFMEM